MLEVVKQENTGWWAAVRGDGTQVGWIPASYVRTIPDATAAKLYARQEDENARRSASGSAPTDFESSDEEETDFGTSTTFSADTDGTAYTDALDEQSIGTVVTAAQPHEIPRACVFGQWAFPIRMLMFQLRLCSKSTCSKHQIRKHPLQHLQIDPPLQLPSFVSTSLSLRLLFNIHRRHNGACAIAAAKAATSSFLHHAWHKCKTETVPLSSV